MSVYGTRKVELCHNTYKLSLLRINTCKITKLPKNKDIVNQIDYVFIQAALK